MNQGSLIDFEPRLPYQFGPKCPNLATVNLHPISPKFSQIWVFQEALEPYCSTKILIVGLLLFKDPSVVLLLVLTLATVFSSQRSGALPLKPRSQ